jgi:predicted permease
LRIIREQLVESAIVASLGWGLGLLVALALIQFFGQSVQMHAAVTLTLQLSPTLNLSVLAVSLFATAFAIIAVGIGPAIRQTRGDVRDAIAADGAAISPRWRFRGVLVAAQVATSVLLVALSTMCLRELRASLQHDPGFALDRLAVLQLDFSANQYERARVMQELDAVSDVLRRDSGVQSVAVMSALPIGSGRPASAGVATPEQALPTNARTTRSARWMAVSGPVFETLGVSLVSGRALNSGDDSASDHVVVVSQSLADDLYPHGAVGRSIIVKRLYFQPERPVVEATIVGVVADTDTDTFGSTGHLRFAVYLPLPQTDEKYVGVVARTSGSPAHLIGPMREAMRGVDREVAVIGADTGLAIAGPAVMVLQVTGGMAGALGGFALLLSVTGLYGVLSDVVTRRTREIGIRVALGAARQAIHRMVLFDGLMPVGIGAAIGAALAYASSIALPAFVFLRQVKTAGVETLALSMTPLAVAALIACYLPARRASRVDPNVALREL